MSDKKAYADGEDAEKYWEGLKELANKYDIRIIYPRAQKLIDENIAFIDPDGFDQPISIHTLKNREYNHTGAIKTGRWYSMHPNFQEIDRITMCPICRELIKRSGKLSFLNCIDDGKRLDVWKKDYKVYSMALSRYHIIKHVILDGYDPYYFQPSFDKGNLL